MTTICLLVIGTCTGAAIVWGVIELLYWMAEK